MPREMEPSESRGGYRTRRYRPADRGGVMALDRAVWDRERDPGWFRWKYEETPYVEEPPVFVAESERTGAIVGARPFMAFELRAGEETRLVLQPSDTMVHPDHRRRGVFTRMNERALDAYEDGAPGLYFNFPNQQSKPGYEKLGWRAVRRRVTHYRVERPAALLGESAPERWLGQAAGVSVRGYVRARRAVGARSPGDGLAIERVEGAPIDRLAALYRRRIPERLHANREPRFLRWRLASPEWTRTTFLARTDGEDVCALVSRTRELQNGSVLTQFADALPMVGDGRRREALEALLTAALEAHEGTDLFGAAPGAIPADLLADLGFLTDDQLPLSMMTAPEKTLLTRPMVLDRPGAWTMGGRRIDDPDSWHLSFLERDTA